MQIPRLLRIHICLAALLFSACGAEVRTKHTPGTGATAGTRASAAAGHAAKTPKGAAGRPVGPVCVNGELSVPHSPTDPCSQADSSCVAAGGNAYAMCEQGTWQETCFCIALSQPRSVAICGDGLIERSTEQCDGTNLNQATCMSLGFQGGVLRCNATTCLYDMQMCRS